MTLNAIVAAKFRRIQAELNKILDTDGDVVLVSDVRRIATLLETQAEMADLGLMED